MSRPRRNNPPQEAGGAELDARREQRQYTAGRLRAGRTPLEVVEVVGHAAVVADAAIAAVRARVPPRAPSACREGCAWCCYQRVGTAAPEVLNIVAYLRRTLSPEQWGALEERVREAQGPRRACPLLVEGRCLAYPVRPLTCRGCNSSDARLCERALDPRERVEVPRYAPQTRVATFVLDGLRAGVGENKLDGELLELAAALGVALREPDCEARWLAGEAVFAGVRLH
jgi:hypothetical protein